jgi:hypothetical protein
MLSVSRKCASSSFMFRITRFVGRCTRSTFSHANHGINQSSIRQS